MKLHAYFRSSTSYRLRIALNLKGLDYQVVPVNIVKGEQKEPKFLSHNPFAGVPLLEADGRDRAQSMAILEWLDEAYPERPLLPASVEDRFTARELAYAIATDIHAVNNLSVMKYLKNEQGHEQAAIDTWYRHWLAKTLVPVEARLAQLGANEALHSAPGMFETVLIPQMYNARRFALDTSAMPHIERIEAACLALPEFQRAHPDNQPDTPKEAQAQ
jgi:maleylacetoacetate isomerase